MDWLALTTKLIREVIHHTCLTPPRRTRKEVKAKRLHIRPSPLIEPCGELILILKMASYAGGRPVDVSGNYYVHADGSTVAGWSLPPTGQCDVSPKRTFFLFTRPSLCHKH